MDGDTRRTHRLSRFHPRSSSAAKNRVVAVRCAGVIRKSFSTTGSARFAPDVEVPAGRPEERFTEVLDRDVTTEALFVMAVSLRASFPIR
jgi:hypothetical protein